MQLFTRIIGGIFLGLFFGLAASFVLSGFFPHTDLMIQNWAMTQQTHKDSISAAVAPAMLCVLGGGALGLLGALVPRRNK